MHRLPIWVMPVVGVLTRDFYLETLPQWGFVKQVADLPGFGDRDYEATDYGDFRIALARYFTGRVFAHITTLEDETQESYFMLTGGNPLDWPEEMLSLVTRVSENTDNYRYFLLSGERHGTIYDNKLYTEEIGGTRLRDWDCGSSSGSSCGEC